MPQVGEKKDFANGNQGVWDGQGWKKVLPNDPPQPSIAGMPGPSGKNPSTGLARMAPQDVLKGIISLLTAGTQFIPGGGPLGMALRTTAFGLGNAAEGAIDGGMEGAKSGAENGMMLGATGEGLGMAIPAIADTLALATGGAKDAIKGAGAYARENANRGGFNKLPVGSAAKARSTATSVGEDLGKVEKAATGTVPTSDFAGATDVLQKDQRVGRDAVRLRTATQGMENSYVKDKEQLYGPDLNMSDVGELYRARQQDARSLIQKRQDKLPISPKEEHLGKLDSALAERGKLLYNKLDEANGGVAAPLNARLSDLHVINGGNREMGKNAHVLAPLSMLGRRAAAGAAIGGATAASGDGDWKTNSAMGAMLGPILLAPSNLSRMGMIAGQTAKTIPAISEVNKLVNNPALQSILDELKKRSGK